MGKIEREEARHRKAVEQVMGDAFASFVDCPLCTIFPAGFVPNLPSLPDELVTQLAQAVYDYLQGRAEIEPPYVEGRTMAMCPDCEGWGQVRSGAKNPMTRIYQCPACNGQGFVPRVELAAAPTPAAVALGVAGASPTQTLPYLDFYGNPCAMQPDAHGRLWGDPSFGHPAPVETPAA
jgi:hypothetical protein